MLDTMKQRVWKTVRRLLPPIDFAAEFPEAVVKTMPGAELGAREDFEQVRGRRLWVADVYINHECGSEDYYYAPEGCRFLVRVLTRAHPDDLTRWMDNKHLDPYWDVEILDGLGVIPADRIKGVWGYMYGRTWRVERE